MNPLGLIRFLVKIDFGMKNRKILVFLLLFPLLVMAETGLRLIPLDGAEQTWLLTRIGKMQFRSDSLYLYAPDGMLLGESYVLDINRIEFAADATALENTSVPSVRISPNPAMDCLLLEGAGNAATARVFSLDGRLMLTESVRNGSAVIQVGTLPAGTWLLQVNTSLIKFIKQ